MLAVMRDRARIWFPTKWIVVLLAIVVVDLISTAVLHRYGLIVEMNPIMRPIIEESEWLFALVKGLTLVLGWHLFRTHFRQNPRFVEAACIAGSALYCTIWLGWFLAGTR